MLLEPDEIRWLVNAIAILTLSVLVLASGIVFGSAVALGLL